MIQFPTTMPIPPDGSTASASNGCYHTDYPGNFEFKLKFCSKCGLPMKLATKKPAYSKVCDETGSHLIQVGLACPRDTRLRRMFLILHTGINGIFSSTRTFHVEDLTKVRIVT